MGVLFNVFVGLAVVNTVLLLGAFGAWYYSLRHYTEYMGDRSRAIMKFALPVFMLLLGSPIIDVVLWAFFGFDFPTVGFLGTAFGLIGAGASLGFVIVDMSQSTSLDPLRSF